MNATKIMHGLWAGPFQSLRHIEELEAAGLQVVVSVLPIGTAPCDQSAKRIRASLNGRDLRHRIIIAADDDDTLDPEYLFRCLDDPGPTLIHCNAGQNRSTAMAACWLLLHKRDKDPIDALNRVGRARAEDLGHPPSITKEMRGNVMRFAIFLKRIAQRNAQKLAQLADEAPLIETLNVPLLKAGERTAGGRVYTEEALRSVAGKEVPITDGIGGPVIGKAKLNDDGTAHLWMDEPLKPMSDVTLMQMRMHEGEVPEPTFDPKAICWNCGWTLKGKVTVGYRPGWGWAHSMDGCGNHAKEGYPLKKPPKFESYTEIFAPVELLREATADLAIEDLLQGCGDYCGPACITRTPAEEVARHRRLKGGGCPDGGACHHKCESDACYRVQSCWPLSGIFPEDKWPTYLLESNQSGAVPDDEQFQPEEVRMSSVKVGAAVVYADQQGKLLNAVVLTSFGQHQSGEDQETAWKDGEVGPTINVAFADPDSTKTDTYGRQFKRETSVPHKSGSTAHGYWWLLPEEL